ncbi:MAG: glycosyltransferase, partial [Desemzia incerta]
MNPLISIIVPVYNVEKYIQQCIESILNQTY